LSNPKPVVRRPGSDNLLFALLFVLLGFLLTIIISLPAAIIITPALYFLWRLSRRVKTLENKIAELTEDKQEGEVVATTADREQKPSND